MHSIFVEIDFLQIPQALIQSLENVKGFDKKAFEAIHESGEQVVSIRLNPAKPIEHFPLQSSIETTVPWCEHGYYLSERPSFTLDPVFHAGAYYVQEASSMFLWEVLKQLFGNDTNKKVLDLCAAPGGKTTLLASYFSNGLVVSNEVIKSRASILEENISKWGSEHIVVTNNDPNNFKRLPNFFDAIIIDAPCSGSGLFKKDADAIHEWSEENVQLCKLRQQRIVGDTIHSLKEGGILIYSTCSYSEAENEFNLDYIKKQFDVASIQLQLNADWNIIETESKEEHCFGYRFYPDKLKGEGFFIAAFKKKDAAAIIKHQQQLLTLATKYELPIIESFLALPEGYTIFKQNDFLSTINTIWLEDIQQLAKHLYIKKAGVELGCIKGKDFIPSHELALSILPKQGITSIELDKEQALQYLRKKELQLDGIKGWNLVTHCGLPLGWIKVLQNRINNYYPSSWRILKD